MPLFEAWSWDGTLIATNLNQASKILKFPGTAKKYLYCWDIEWLRLPNKNYSELYDIYNSKELKLIARNEEHKKIIEQAFNCHVEYTSEDISVDFLKTLLESA